MNKKFVVVLCGTFFPSDIRDIAHILGFICVYPSGNRYGVVSPPTEFVIERWMNVYVMIASLSILQ